MYIFRPGVLPSRDHADGTPRPETTRLGHAGGTVVAALVQYGIALFLALHGLVHVWYVVLSQDWVEVEEAMAWDGKSWLLSGVLPDGLVLGGASVVYAAVAAGFVAGAVGYVLDTDWSTSVLVGSAVLSTVGLVVMWDGRFDLLVEKGIPGLFVNAFVVLWLLVLE